jgi:hypothetical protein
MAYYVQLEASYWRHPKTLKLIELLGRFADIYPPRLWSWAAQYRTSGVLASAKELALACDYRGNADKLLGAMRDAGFIDQSDLTIHDWSQKTGHGILMYEKEKERQKLKAERIRAEKEAKNNLGTSHGTSQENTSVRTTITGPDLTGPDLTGEEQSPPPPARGSPRRSRKPTVDQILTEAVQEGDSRDREKSA